MRLKDVGRAELGAENYSTVLRFNGHEAVGIGITQLPFANALEVDRAVRQELARLSKRFPPGLEYAIAFDATTVVDESINEVTHTLIDAILLVMLVMFLFLQSWRSTLIPAITIPVSLVGTFIFVKLMGFSINTLTLFGLTLATGLVVDDAIVVIENIARFVEEKGMSPLQAASEAMKEVFGAVIATSLVLIAVFVPVAFFPGTTGQLYQQFALTIAFSIAISTFNAVTLTPALSALLLRPHTGQTGGIAQAIFSPFNRGLNAVIRGYRGTLQWATRFKALVLALFVLSLGLTAWLFQKVPTGFVPNEDQGYFLITLQGPEGASLAYTGRAMARVEQELAKIPEITGVFAVGGFSFGGSSPNKAMFFPNLKPLEERKRPDQSVRAIVEKVRGPLMGIQEAIVVPFEPPAIRGVGNFGGFQFQLQDRSGGDIKTLAEINQTLVQRGNQTPGLGGMFSSFTANDPQVLVNVERDRAKALGVPLSQIFDTLQVFLGSQYVNDFDYLNRIYRVYVQADQPFRANPRDIRQFYVRSDSQAMIPLDNLVRVTPTTAPQNINHFNLFRSTEINGSPAPGYSSGQAIAAMESLARQVLPPSMGYEWAGIALEQLESGGQALWIFALGLLFVFLVLAAQYESFIDPLIIILSVPLAMLGALLTVSVRGLENDVFCQIGLVMLIGLASKNAILIVEFANQLREQGRGLTEAAIEASIIRFRPIVMTSLAFILGVAPLAFASGAGAASRQSLGTAVFGGMIVSTVLSLLVVPVLYIIINQWKAGLIAWKNARRRTPRPLERV